MHKKIDKTTPVLFLIVCCALITGCSNNHIVIENDYFKYVISDNGTNLQFTDKAMGKNYLDTEVVTKCASATVDGTEYPASAVAFEDRQLHMEFGNTGVSIQLNVHQSGDRIVFKVASVAGKMESLTFMNVPLKLEGQPYEPFAACVLSMNLFGIIVRSLFSPLPDT